MNLTVTIAGNNKTALISWTGFQINDVKDNQVNTCKFIVKTSDTQTWQPNVGDSITVTDGSTTIFAGQVVRITHNIDGLMGSHAVECSDYVFALKGAMVTASYQNHTVTYIISDLNTNYLAGLGYDVSEAVCGTTLSSIQFDNISVADALQKLADAVGWSWDVGYNKHIKFYDINGQAAPFNLDDSSGNYVFNSLQTSDDISQVRNLVRVAGGTAVGSNRTEYLSGDGTRTQWPLANKFHTKPSATVSSVSKTVGVENLDNPASFDFMWDYNAQSLRATAGAVASGTNNIAVTGAPEIPIIAEVQDPVSIAKFGTRGYYTKDTTITSKQEAKDRAGAEIGSYADSITEGTFRTQSSGLVAGQTITVQSAKRGISATQYIIQQVNLKLTGSNKGDWSVTLATLRTIGILKFLQDQLMRDQQIASNPQNIEIDKYYQVNEDVQVAELIANSAHMQDYQDVQVTEQVRKDPWTPEFVLAPYTVTGDSDNKREGYLDISLYAY